MGPLRAMRRKARLASKSALKRSLLLTRSRGNTAPDGGRCSDVIVCVVAWRYPDEVPQCRGKRTKESRIQKTPFCSVSLFCTCNLSAQGFMAKTGFLDALIDTLQTNCRGVGSESRPTLAPIPAIRSRGKRVRETRSGHRCRSTFPYLHNWWRVGRWSYGRVFLCR